MTLFCYSNIKVLKWINTNENTEKIFLSIIPSVNPLIIKNIIISASVLYVNPLVIIFFYYQRIYLWKKNYREKIHRQIIFINDSVSKLITDEICVLHRRKNFVNKTVKFYSGNSSVGHLVGPIRYKSSNQTRS